MGKHCSKQQRRRLKVILLSLLLAKAAEAKKKGFKGVRKDVLLSSIRRLSGAKRIVSPAASNHISALTLLSSSVEDSGKLYKDDVT